MVIRIMTCFVSNIDLGVLYKSIFDLYLHRVTTNNVANMQITRCNQTINY